MSIQRAFSRFGREESGAGTIFGLFIFIVIAMVLSLAVDSIHAWRNRTYLTSSADIGAHAGAAMIAEKGSRTQIVNEIERVVEWNMPTNLFGNVLDNAADITLAHYDPETRTFTGYETGNDNAVVVSVEQSDAHGNPLYTNLMQFLGIDRMQIHALSAAVYDYNPNCPGTDGIWAKGQVTLTSLNDIGPEICIHSSDFVWLPQQNNFHDGSLVTMPNLNDCKDKCQESANPGINAVAMNYVFPEFGDFITNSYLAFAGPMGTSGVKWDFFNDNPGDPHDAAVPLGNQTQLLAALGETTPYAKGDVVSMSVAEFNTIHQLPSGLVYQIDCPSGGNGPNTRLVFDNAKGQMDNSVLLTNCSLNFDDGASVVGSVVITLREANNAVVTAGSSITMGDPTNSCVSHDRTTIMSMSDVSVPAEFAMSNVTLIVDGDANIASATSSGISSNGFSVYASGEVHMASQHTLRTCGDVGDYLVPRAKVIRLVVPPSI